jgi:MFS transporter, PAT family, beta-lactamase induction signal transducer AmpG
MLTCVPYGVSGIYTGTVMPYLASEAKIDVETIGWFTTLLFVPTWLQFLYAPIVDVGPKRKHWLVLLSVIAAGCYMGASVLPLPDQVTPFLVCSFAGQMITGLVGACNGGIMASTLPDDVRGSAGAWYNVGNLSGGAIAGYIALQFSDDLEPWVIGSILAAMMIGSSLAILMVVEPPHERRTIREVFRTMWRDVRAVLFSRGGITGILLCASPVGTAAIVNSMSAYGRDYDVSKGWLAFITGIGNAILSAVGAFAGGWLCDNYSRRAMYLISGVLTSAVAFGISLSPHTQTTYLVGISAYLLVAGFCYAAFTATVLESIGKAGKAASTQYTLFTAAGNLAIAYVGKFDTGAYNTHEVNGVKVGEIDAVMRMDSLLNLAGVALLGLIFWKLNAFGTWRRQPGPT